MRKRLAFRIGSVTIPLEQMTEKEIVATRSIPIYRQVRPAPGPVVFTVKPGQSVGRLYSWVGGGTSPLYLMFYDTNQKPYYMLYDNNINFDVLGQQGAKSYEELEKERKEKETDSGSMFPSIPNPFEGMGEGLQSALKTGILIAASGVALLFLTRGK